MQQIIDKILTLARSFLKQKQEQRSASTNLTKFQDTNHKTKLMDSITFGKAFDLHRELSTFGDHVLIFADAIRYCQDRIKEQEDIVKILLS